MVLSAGLVADPWWARRSARRGGGRMSGMGRQGVAAARVTPRAAEVLARVVEHLSNADIAALLFISVRTVETHVSALLRKLDVPDRRALARYAADLAHTGRAAPALSLPSSLTPFIGRVRDRADLAEAIKTY